MEKKNMKKEKRMRKTIDLKEKIYLLLYDKQNYIAGISQIIYGAENCKSIDRAFIDLRDEEWVEKTGYKPPSVSSSGSRLDTRRLRRQYYKATVKPLFDSILKDLKSENVSLTPGEEETLKQYLDGKSFRRLVYDITQKNGRLRNKNVNFAMVKQTLVHLSTYNVFTENWVSTRAFRALPLLDHLFFGKTHPIFALGTPLCKKLMHLDPFSSNIIYQSFDAVSNMILGTFEPVLKNYMWKLDKSTMEKAHKTGRPLAFVRIPMDPDLPLEWEVFKKKKE